MDISIGEEKERLVMNITKETDSIECECEDTRLVNDGSNSKRSEPLLECPEPESSADGKMEGNTKRGKHPRKKVIK